MADFLIGRKGTHDVLTLPNGILQANPRFGKVTVSSSAQFSGETGYGGACVIPGGNAGAQFVGCRAQDLGCLLDDASGEFSCHISSGFQLMRNACSSGQFLASLPRSMSGLCPAANASLPLFTA
jgi:hypothetical protein